MDFQDICKHQWILKGYTSWGIEVLCPNCKGFKIVRDDELVRIKGSFDPNK